MRRLVEFSGFWTTFPLFGGDMLCNIPAFPSQCDRWLGLNFRVIGPVKQKIYFSTFLHSASAVREWMSCSVIQTDSWLWHNTNGQYWVFIHDVPQLKTPNPCFSFFQPGGLAQWLHMCKCVLPQSCATASAARSSSSHRALKVPCRWLWLVLRWSTPCPVMTLRDCADSASPRYLQMFKNRKKTRR